MIKPWVERRVEELLGYEDELVSNFVISQLEDETDPNTRLDPKVMQIRLTGAITSH